MGKKLVIFGSGEIATLAKFYFSHDSDYEVVAFTVDDEYVTSDTFEGLPLLPFTSIGSAYPPSDFDMHVALSYVHLNKLREQKYIQAKAEGYRLASYVSSKSTIWPDLCVGDNCFVLEDQTIQPTVKIRNNVVLWSGNHIGHGTVIGSHTYMASQVVISGHCEIGERCFFGVNATFADFVTVGDDVFVAMDASVTRNISSGSVVLGAKSTILESDNRMAQKIKRSYFKI